MSDFKQLTVTVDGIEKTVLAQVIDQKLWFRIDQKNECIDLAEISGGQSRKTKAHSKNASLITAPMPGKITKIFVEPGGSVDKSQPLLVMEAMKMEYTLKADFITQVEKVNVKVGDQVTLGFLLIELKPSAGESK